jgi:tRNA C32,U32 (ribose-2'-O)-methylase TrmJ
MLRRIFGRAELTKREVNTLMGVLKKALWTINCRNQQEKDV